MGCWRPSSVRFFMFPFSQPFSHYTIVPMYNGKMAGTTKKTEQKTNGAEIETKGKKQKRHASRKAKKAEWNTSKEHDNEPRRRTRNRYILKNAETCCFESNNRTWYSWERAPARRWIADPRRRYATIFSLRDCCTTAWRKWNLFESLQQLIWTLHVYGEQVANKWKHVWKNLRRWHSFRYATTFCKKRANFNVQCDIEYQFNLSH